MVRAADIESISARRPDVPPQLERIVHHALEKRPDDRYRAGTELASDLERFLHVYSPVFTGARLARFVAQVLQAGTEKAPETPVPVPVPEAFEPRGARVATQRIQPSELIQDRSEITDENSVIFRMEEQVVVLFAGTNGYVDGYEVSEMGRYQKELLEWLRTSKKDVLDGLRSTGKLDEATDQGLRAALDEFGKTFKA